MHIWGEETDPICVVKQGNSTSWLVWAGDFKAIVTFVFACEEAKGQSDLLEATL